MGNLASASQYGPSAVVLGTAGSAFAQTSDFLTDPFSKPLQTTGEENNDYGYINHFTLQPGQTRSLVHFVVIGLSEKTESPAKKGVPALGTQTTAITTFSATGPGDDAGPERRLTTGQLCSIVNWTERSIKAFKPAYNSARCTPTSSTHRLRWSNSRNRRQTRRTTSSASRSPKSAAMKDGETTLAQITKAYLDRIAAYNGGPLGFHAIIDVNPRAMAGTGVTTGSGPRATGLPCWGSRSRPRTSTTPPKCRLLAAASCSKTTFRKRTRSSSSG